MLAEFRRDGFERGRDSAVTIETFGFSVAAQKLVNCLPDEVRKALFAAICSEFDQSCATVFR